MFKIQMMQCEDVHLSTKISKTSNLFHLYSTKCNCLYLLILSNWIRGGTQNKGSHGAQQGVDTNGPNLQFRSFISWSSCSWGLVSEIKLYIVNLVASFRCYQHPTCIVSNKSICNRRPWMQPQYWRTRMSSNLWKEDPDLQKKIQA